MKLKTHAVFKNQIATLEGSVGLVWFMVYPIHSQRHRIERISITKADAARQLSSFFTPEDYKFIKMENPQLPVFKKL
jgi:hypothetical protein